MTDNEIIQAFDVLEKMEFFGGQRAGRELWFNKPIDIQNKDIGKFLRDIDFLKTFINSQQAEIERLQTALLNKEDTMQIIAKEKQQYFDELQTAKSEIERLTDYNENLQTANTALSNEILEAKPEAAREFAERLKETKFKHDNDYIIYAENIDVLVKEMVGDTE